MNCRIEQNDELELEIEAYKMNNYFKKAILTLTQGFKFRSVPTLSCACAATFWESYRSYYITTSRIRTFKNFILLFHLNNQLQV
jgi:hypothetical protein